MLLKAPFGATSFSIDGVSHDVGPDGLVDVDERVAETLKSHGFEQAPPSSRQPPQQRPMPDWRPPPRDAVAIPRTVVYQMLEDLGVAVTNNGLPDGKLVEVLMAACKAKVAPTGTVPVPAEPSAPPVAVEPLPQQAPPPPSSEQPVKQPAQQAKPRSNTRPE